MGAAYIRQRMEEMGRTVNGLEMRDILFLDPHSIQRHIQGICDAEDQDILWMLVTDWQCQGRLIDTTIEQQCVGAVFTLCPNRQSISQSVFLFIGIVETVFHCHFRRNRAVDTGTGTRYNQYSQQEFLHLSTLN
jgi:hypothetical protein